MPTVRIIHVVCKHRQCRRTRGAWKPSIPSPQTQKFGSGLMNLCSADFARSYGNVEGNTRQRRRCFRGKSVKTLTDYRLNCRIFFSTHTQQICELNTLYIPFSKFFKKITTRKRNRGMCPLKKKKNPSLRGITKSLEINIEEMTRKAL